MKDPTLIVTIVRLWMQYELLKKEEPEIDFAEFAIRCGERVREEVLDLLIKTEQEIKHGRLPN